MLTRQHYVLQAKALGAYVIPMCIERDYNAEGSYKWNLNAVAKFHTLGTFLVDFCRRDNPSFDLQKFNTKMLEHAINEEPFKSKYMYLISDFPGMRLRGTEDPPNRHLFEAVHTLWPAEDFHI